jgi:hypothetical protein
MKADESADCAVLCVEYDVEDIALENKMVYGVIKDIQAFIFALELLMTRLLKKVVMPHLTVPSSTT